MSSVDVNHSISEPKKKVFSSSSDRNKKKKKRRMEINIHIEGFKVVILFVMRARHFKVEIQKKCA